jgi:LmbE family N-acetylglucosaminyl deacetylase
MTQTLRLLAVLAHPDDESLGMGGTLARYAQEGVETYLVTATRGDRGRYRGLPQGEPGHPGPAALAEIRERELRAAASTLGVRELSILGYGDGVVDQVESAEAIARIAGHMRRIRPQVVLTFGPEGGYGHPDHIAICQLTTAATMVAADPARVAPDPPHVTAKLYYMASSKAAWDAYQSVFKRLVSTVDGVEREARPWPEWAITTVIDTRAQWALVWRAVSCHESQIGGYERLRHLSPEHHETLWGKETFLRAFSTVNGGRTRETDLFEGLRG